MPELTPVPSNRTGTVHAPAKTHEGGETMHLPLSPEGKFRQEIGAAIQLRKEAMLQRFIPGGIPAQAPMIQRKLSGNGLPMNLLQGIQAHSGHDLSDVNVHRNSEKPGQVGALAYAQGNDIHLGAGQEQHLAHEAAHVVQQREGRVQPNTQVAGLPVNDNPQLEKEADNVAEQVMRTPVNDLGGAGAQNPPAVQRKQASQPSVIEAIQRVESVGEEEDDVETVVQGKFQQIGSLGFPQTHRGPIQWKTASSQQAVVQRQVIQKQDPEEPYVRRSVVVTTTMTGDEFLQMATAKIFAGNPPAGIKWKNVKASYGPADSPVSVKVAASLFKQARGANNNDKGITSAADGSVDGAAGRAKTFLGGPNTKEKADVMSEIDRRYYEAAGVKPGEKITGSKEDKGKAELWRQIQDEVLFQNEYIKNLPDGVKQFIKYSTNGKVLTAADIEQMFRIAKTLEAMPPDIAHEYLSRVTGSTPDLDKFELSLHNFREEMDKQKALVEENNITKGKLLGLEAIYEKLRLYRQLISNASMSSALSSGMGQSGGIGMGGGLDGLGTTMVAMDVMEEIEKSCKAIGFVNGYADFAKFIGQFEAGFEKQAQATAIGYLEKYQGSLYREQSKYADKTMMTDLLTKIKGGADKETLAKEYCIFNDKDLPDNKKVDMARLKAAASSTDLGSMLSGYASVRSTDIGGAKGKVSGDSNVIYKLTNLMPIFYLEQGISKDSIYDKIIYDKIHSDMILKLIVGVAVAIVAIALTVVSLGAATPALVAAGAAALSFGISAFGVYEAYRDYALEKQLANAGLANDPSIIWLIIAVVGAVLDLGAAARAISKLGPAAQAAQVAGDLAEFNRVVAIMKAAGGLDAKAAIAAEKAMQAQTAFKESKKAFELLIDSKGLKSFAHPEFYVELVKMAKFKSMQGAYTLSAFVDELRAVRKLKGLGDLGPDEISKIRQAWEEGRASARVAGEALEASDQLVTSVKSNLLSRVAANAKFELKYTDAELKALITKGRANGFKPQEIEDLIYIGGRKDKPLNAIQLMDQMDFAVYLKARGYPAKFKSLADFQDFSATLKSEISAIGGPTSDIRIQGSALRKATADDVDLVAMMTESGFDDIVKRAYNGKITEGAIKGKGGTVVDLISLDHAGLDALLARIKANPTSFNGIRRDFQYVFENKMINSKQMKAEIKAVFDADQVLANIQAKFPHLNIQNVSFQIPGGSFDLQPFLRL